MIVNSVTYHPTQLYFGMKSDRSLEWERLNYLSHNLLTHYPNYFL
ncbi:MAG: hypothetical protein O4751_13035 [Trichodesmium sp. St2_bin6]|nr:hypothetical protein [Trichodesmium sp. St2_bin6]